MKALVHASENADKGAELTVPRAMRLICERAELRHMLKAASKPLGTTS